LLTASPPCKETLLRKASETTGREGVSPTSH